MTAVILRCPRFPWGCHCAGTILGRFLSKEKKAIPLGQKFRRALFTKVRRVFRNLMRNPSRLMFRFFRQIRAQYLSENRISRYLFYTLGEVLLIVTGILIALQVDNWNEIRKNNQEEVIFLSALREDLKNDLFQLKEISKYQNEKLRTLNRLIDELSNGNADNYVIIDSLFVRTQLDETITFFPNSGSYSSARSMGIINELKPVDLKTAITNLYERFYFRLSYNGSIYDSQSNFVLNERGKYYNPFKRTLIHEEVIDNPGFQNLISIMHYDNSFYVELCASTIREIESVIVLIEENTNLIPD